MTETDSEFLQGQLAQLKRLHERGRLTAAEYRDEITQLGLDPAALIP